MQSDVRLITNNPRRSRRRTNETQIRTYMLLFVDTHAVPATGFSCRLGRQGGAHGLRTSAGLCRSLLALPLCRRWIVLSSSLELCARMLAERRGCVIIRSCARMLARYCSASREEGRCDHTQPNRENARKHDVRLVAQHNDLEKPFIVVRKAVYRLAECRGSNPLFECCDELLCVAVHQTLPVRGS